MAFHASPEIFAIEQAVSSHDLGNRPLSRDHDEWKHEGLNSQGARLIAIYFKENDVLTVPPERISEVYGDLDHHASFYRDLVRSFEGGHAVASRIIELSQSAWDEALEILLGSKRRSAKMAKA